MGGARQEDRIRRGLDAWRKLATKLVDMKATPAGISDDEWTNTQGFLRRLYGLREDMGYLSRGFPPDKAKKADAFIETFKKKVKAMDKPAKAKNLDQFLEEHKVVVGYLEEWFDFLNDADNLEAAG